RRTPLHLEGDRLRGRPRARTRRHLPPRPARARPRRRRAQRIDPSTARLPRALRAQARRAAHRGHRARHVARAQPGARSRRRPRRRAARRGGAVEARGASARLTRSSPGGTLEAPMPPTDVVLANVRNRTYDYPYLGIAYLAALLERRGVRVRILDGSPLELPPAALAAEVAALRPRVFGLPFMSPDVPGAYAVVRGGRERLPETEVVVGGPHVGADPTIVHDMGLRWGFAGESETSFPTFVEALLGGGAPPSDLPALVDGERVNPANN